MRKLVRTFLFVESAICIGAFVLMVAMVFLQVVNRNLLHLPSIDWTEELARYSMIWMALFGTQIGLRQGKQMSVEFFTSRFSERTIKYIDFFADFCCFAFALITLIYSQRVLAMQLRSGQTSAALDIPMVYMYASVSVSFLIMTVGKLVEMISYFVTGGNPHRRGEASDPAASALEGAGGGAA
ncbi:MAG: TRAP transporter small permease [Planctomycetes bacterium]|nr:TRAP transporter small permease [Planctomycetota bacterium]